MVRTASRSTFCYFSCHFSPLKYPQSGISPNILQEVEIPVVGNNECECAYPNAITDNMICAGLKEGGKDSCQVTNILCISYLKYFVTTGGQM